MNTPEDNRKMDVELRVGACYSNGDFGRRWEVRQVVVIHPDGHVQYRVLVGERRRRSGKVDVATFRAWARYQVERNENVWERVG